MDIRPEIKELSKINREERCDDYYEDILAKIERLLESISRPLNYSEASVLVSFISSGSCYGLFVKKVTTKPVVGVGRYTSPDAMVSQWTMIHLAEFIFIKPAYFLDS